MRSLHRLCVVFLKDRCTNSDVRERCGLKEDVVTGVEGGMLRWFGHLERMNESGLTKTIYRASVCDGKVGKDCPRKSYADHVGGINNQILSTRNRRACLKRIMDFMIGIGPGICAEKGRGGEEHRFGNNKSETLRIPESIAGSAPRRRRPYVVDSGFTRGRRQ
ncbi:hypothetical protein EVAR_12344_1 [Eumeta japonica]|uniref:Uncharacterized protein n=1 Tax=Eumeta variegata TaxID=151549 RepID=A0A4C1X320_EUMVA|nr:hypothetical protein EVAR_12344_1 [Eumeta japonica]